MELLKELLDWVLHLDHHLGEVIGWMGEWFYALMFGVVFCETGLVVTPFLPGDSLLFALGSLARTQPQHVSVWILWPLLTIAAIAGDAVNYAIGKALGPRVFYKDTGWLLNKAHLLRAQAFYVKHGGKAIVLARFLPIVRTFAPFVAGIGQMNYRRFWIYNAAGAVAWVTIFLLGGYLFSNFKVVQDNFSLVIVAIVFISAIPVAYEWYRAKFANTRGD
jgi:membrane-associated protein